MAENVREPAHDDVALVAQEASGPDLSASKIQELSVAGTLAASREQAEIQAAYIIAQKYKRSEAESFGRLYRSIDRPLFAAKALYSFPRGGTTITGPSVALAREAARCWGNIRSGIRIIESDDKWISLVGWCLDLETNSYKAVEDKFKRLIQRKDKKTGQTVWVVPDERDTRELQNKRGAICERNAILQLLPADLIEEAISRVKASYRGKGVDKSLEQGIRDLIYLFHGAGISREMVERRVGHGIDDISLEEYGELQSVFTSIQDGNSNISEYFSYGGAKQEEDSRPQSKRIADKIKAKQAPPPEDPPSDDGPKEYVDRQTGEVHPKPTGEMFNRPEARPGADDELM